MASGRGGGRSRSSSSRSSSGRSSGGGFRSSGGFRGSRTRFGVSSGGYGGIGFAGAGIAGIFMGVMFVIFPLFAGLIMFLSFLPDLIGTPSYDDNDFQDYCYEIYYDEFSNYEATEDYLLLVIATEDFDYYDYYYMAFAGDHISADVRSMLGDNYSVLGEALGRYINSSSYKYSLDIDISAALNQTATVIATENDIYTCTENHSSYQAKFENRSSIELDADELNNAAMNFTKKTGIPIYLIVDDINNVYELVRSVEAIFPVIFTSVIPLIFVAAGIFLIVRSVKGMKKNKNTPRTTANIGGSLASENVSTSNEDDKFKIDPKEYEYKDDYYDKKF